MSCRIARSPELLPLAGHLFGGRYRLDRVLASGGMGVVWAAEDLGSGRPVAVKLMHTELRQSTELVTRFKQEAIVAASLQSRHIIDVGEFGFEDDTAYFTMERLRGEDLETRVLREGRLPFKTLLPIILETALGLDHVHSAGFIHCDIKPGNIFLVQHDEGELIKVLDFGIARPTGWQLNDDSSEIVLGSPAYMSPEQVRHLTWLDHRTDVWSLAVVVFRCITGVLPFSGDRLVDILTGICMDPVPRASSLESGAPRGIDEFFERALARDPRERFASVLELAAAFAALPSGGEQAGSLPRAAPHIEEVRDVRALEGAVTLPVEQLERCQDGTTVKLSWYECGSVKRTLPGNALRHRDQR